MDKHDQALIHLETTLRNFISFSQAKTIYKLMDGEEGEFFIDKINALAERVLAMPMVPRDPCGDDPVLSLHYFIGGVDAWVILRDQGDTPADNGLKIQHQAFGYQGLFGGGFEDAEMGYLSIRELLRVGAELDLHFEPTRVSAMRATEVA